MTQVSFGFTVSTTGNYMMHFDNRDGALAKSATFNYNDKIAVFGFPQDTFILVLAIMIVIYRGGNCRCLVVKANTQ
ncbi:MAG TPA: hypothetical protein VMD05_04405 [Candidatus Nanoarchaeia archaeon]|nr:hypothetical protein [Candidatus Nanoarchaeia archaeon]